MKYFLVLFLVLNIENHKKKHLQNRLQVLDFQYRGPTWA